MRLSRTATDRRLCVMHLVHVLCAALLLCIVSACGEVSVTGRKQLILVPESVAADMGAQAYQQVLADGDPVTTGEAVEILERVGRRIAAVAPENEYDWQFTLLNDNTVNAFALPGGKVVFYRGILPYCRNEAGLAVVMAHEIAHVIARHGSERMSQQVAVSGGAMALNAYLSHQGVEPSTRNMWMVALGVGSQLGVILPYSRTHEHEADYIGLRLMAEAGYDPEVAPEFWERFSAGKGAAPPEFLSTHPHDENRAKRLRAKLPEAKKLYAQAQTTYGTGAELPVQGGSP